MTTMLGWLCAVMLLAVSVLVLYQWVLAVAAMLPSRARPRAPGGDRTRFLILVPAHSRGDTMEARLTPGTGKLETPFQY